MPFKDWPEAVTNYKAFSSMDCLETSSKSEPRKLRHTYLEIIAPELSAIGSSEEPNGEGFLPKAENGRENLPENKGRP